MPEYSRAIILNLFVRYDIYAPPSLLRITASNGKMWARHQTFILLSIKCILINYEYGHKPNKKKTIYWPFEMVVMEEIRFELARRKLHQLKCHKS